MKKITESLRVIDPENTLNSENITKWAVGEEEFVIDLTEEELIQDALGSNIENIESFEPEDDVNMSNMQMLLMHFH